MIRTSRNDGRRATKRRRSALGRLAPWLALAALACGDREPRGAAPLVGAWRSEVRFESGAFAAVEDLEFMYVFNSGGTLTESSNYDGAPPVPPAYGVWRALGGSEYEARYEFYATAPPPSFETLAGGGGWSPAGRGVLVERITLAPDSRSFTSTLRYEAFDRAGNPVAGGGEAKGSGVRIAF